MTPSPDAVKEALAEADCCSNSEEGDCGTGAVVLAAAYRQSQEELRKAEAALSELKKIAEGMDDELCRLKDIVSEDDLLPIGWVRSRLRKWREMK